MKPDDQMRSREEQLGKKLLALYEFIWTPSVEGIKVVSQSDKHKFDSIWCESFSSWHEMLFGSSHNGSLNDFIETFFIEKQCIHFSSLDELDILLTLTGCS